MINYTNILNTTGLTMTGGDLRYRCELDGLNMMAQLEKTPIKAYYILLVAVIILLIYILIPKVKEYYSTDKILFPVFILSMTSLGLYSFTTFNITRTVWDSRINPILTTLFIIVIIYILWNERENIKKGIKILREL